jgi:CspA family cold shock protein
MRRQHPDDVVTGRVQRWYPEEGWGVLESNDLDGSVFAHYSSIRDQSGRRGLEAGQQVTFTWEQPGQDGCEYSAVDIYTTEARTPVPPPEAPPGGSAYSSSLTIEFDPPPSSPP